MVDEVKKVAFSSTDRDKKLKNPTNDLPNPVSPIEIVSEGKVKEDIALKGFALERTTEEETPAFADDKDAQKLEVKRRTSELRKELAISKRNAKRLAKGDVKTDVAEQVVERSTYFIDKEQYDKYKQEHPEAEHLVLLDDKYKKVLNTRAFDSAFDGRKRDAKGNIVQEGTLNSDKLKEITGALVGSDAKLDLDENVAGAAQSGLTNKKGNVRRSDARIYRHMFRDMGYNIELDKTEARRAVHIGKTALQTAITTATLGTVVGELTDLLNVSGTISGTVVGSVVGTVGGEVIGQVKGKAQYKGEAAYKADYNGVVEGEAAYKADYNGVVEGNVAYKAGYNGVVEGNVAYKAGYNGVVEGSAAYKANYSQTVGCDVDSTAYYIDNNKVIATDTQTVHQEHQVNGVVEGNTAYKAGYSGVVEGNAAYKAGYSGVVEGNAAYKAGYNGTVEGNAAYKAGYNGTVEGNAAYKANYNGTVEGKVGYQGEADYTAEYKAQYEAEYKADYEKEYKANYKDKPSLADKVKNNALTGAVAGTVTGFITAFKVNDIKRPPTVDVLQGGSVDKFVDDKLVESVKGKTSRKIAKKMFELGASDADIKAAITEAMGKNTGKRLTEAELFQAYQTLKEKMQPAEPEKAPDMPELKTPKLSDMVKPTNVNEINIKPVEVKKPETVDDGCKAEAAPVDKNQKAAEMHIDIRGKLLYDAIAKGYSIKNERDLYAAIGKVKEKHNISQSERNRNKGIADLYLEDTLELGNGKIYNLNRNLKREDIADIPEDQYNSNYESSRGHKTPSISIQAGKVTLSCSGQVREYDTYKQAQEAAKYYNEHGIFPEDE